MERSFMCPQCNAPLRLHPFARAVVCEYCGATVQIDEDSVPAADFHKSFQRWNAPETYGFASWVSMGNRHWALERSLAQGETTDVYAGRLARWPTELVIVKILRDEQHKNRLEQEWNSLQVLHQSSAPGADTFTMLIPQPVLHGELTGGSFAGRHASIFRWESGFHHTFEDVMQVYPDGIPPRASIWVWRRILEVLSFIHASGMAHGALLPAHLLVHAREHGVRLVGYSAAGRVQEKLRVISAGYAPYYPKTPGSLALTPELDLVMSARCIAALLGGDPQTGSLPPAVPGRLAALVQRIALAEPQKLAGESAWRIREDLGRLAKEIFGPSRYIPIEMPPPG